MVPGAGTAFGVLRRVPGAGMIPGLDQGLRPEGSPSSSSPGDDQQPDQDQYPDQTPPPYGDQYTDQQGGSDMNHREEEMERLGLDDDSGWGFSSITHALKRGARGLEHGVEKGAGDVYKYSGAKYIVTKAEEVALYPIKRVIRAFKNKMVGRKSQELARQRGLAAPGPAEKAAALTWAKNYTRHAHPTYGKIVASMMGGPPPSDEMGNPLLIPLIAVGAVTLALILEQVYKSAFSHGSPAAQPVGPDGQPLPLGPDGQPMSPDGTPYAGSLHVAGRPLPRSLRVAGRPPIRRSERGSLRNPNADPYASQGEDMSTGITGEDSLGAFATEILSGTPQASPPGTKADQLVNLGVNKLRSGRPLTPGEVGIIARLAKRDTRERSACTESS